MEFDSAKLARLRANAGLSRDQLAKTSGVSKTWIKRLENGQADNPTLETLRLLAAGLGVAAEELLVSNGNGEGEAA